ncbi:hypothetical protein IHE61_31100 [Streptomyces sp. GKU 257-1]|nr:hypothetical protein [Streptomyces sp. GKU 257-1]
MTICNAHETSPELAAATYEANAANSDFMRAWLEDFAQPHCSPVRRTTLAQVEWLRDYRDTAERVMDAERAALRARGIL